MATVLAFDKRPRNLGRYETSWLDASQYAGSIGVSAIALLDLVDITDTNLNLEIRVEAADDSQGKGVRTIVASTWQGGSINFKTLLPYTDPPSVGITAPKPWPSFMRAVVVVSKRVSIGLNILLN